MKISHKMTVALAVVTSMAVFSPSANASGWFAKHVIKPISPHLAHEADKLNAQLHNPFDHAIAAGANVVAPGSGTALETGWAVQRAVR